MPKTSDRAKRSGSDPIIIGSSKIATDSNNDISIVDTSGNAKKVIASEVHLGTGSDKVILKRSSSDGKLQLQTTDGSSTSNSEVSGDSGGAGGVTVQEEGSALSTTATTLNFVGSAITASGGGATKTITVSASSGGAVTVYANTAALQAASGASEGDLGFVSATKKLMLRTSTGWYFVATVTNASPVISSAGNASYSFATDGTPIVIDVAATEPEGETLTYAYQVTSGSLGSTAAVVQGTGSNVNRFTITPSQNSSHSGTFTLKFSATDPNSNIALSDGSTFTLAFDVSGSLYFDGSGDLIVHSASSDFTMGTGDYTIECWIDWATDDLSGNNYLLSLGGNALRISHNSGVFKCFGSGSNKLEFTPTTAEKTGWHHIALVRNGNTHTVYYDGQSKVSGSFSYDHTNNSLCIGAYDNGALATNGGYEWTAGYLSNIRIVKGTAVYTSNFTPSTTGLTAISGTVYLVASNIVPISITNGTYHFTTTSSRITADSTDFNLSSSTAFTLEYWYQLKSGSSNSDVMFDMGSGNMFQLYLVSGNIKLYSSQMGGYAVDMGSGVGRTENTWYHVAIVGDGSGNTKVYLDGTQVGSTHNGSWSISGGRIRINGYAGSGYTNIGVVSYISDFRIVNGTAVYTGNFTPPSGPLTTTGGTYPSNTNVNTSITASHTKLLTCQNSSGSLVDNSPTGHTLSTDGTVTPIAGNEKITTDVSSSAHALTITGNVAYSYATPFSDGNGGSVLMNDSANNWLLAGSSSDFSFGTGDFTVEGWVYLTGTDGGIFHITSNNSGTPSSNSEGVALGIQGSTNLWRMYGAGGPHNAASSANRSVNTWYHFAVVKTGGYLKTYVDGTAIISTSDTTDYNNLDYCSIGLYHSNSYAFDGYISNFRVVKGTAVYTSNFTKPSAKLTAITNTKLLTCNDSNQINDASSSNQTITLQNRPIPTKFIPF